MALAVISSKYFDNSRGYTPHIIHISGDIYAIAYEGAGSRGTLKTISIDSAGDIGAVLDTWEFNTGGYSYPFIIHISGDVYAIAYKRYTGVGTNYDGYLVTFSIDSEGGIGDLIDEEVFSVNASAGQNWMIHISGDIYAIVFARGAYENGYIVTVEIDSAGNIINPIVDGHLYDSRVTCIHPCLIHISGTTYAIGYYRGIITITIGNDGSISADPELDSVEAYYPYEIVHIAGDVYAIVRVRWLETLTIDAAGNISDTAVDSLEYDASANWCPIIFQLAAGSFAIIYQGADLDGFIKTVNIESNGTIGSILETFEFDTSAAQWPSAIEIAPGIIAIAYSSGGYGRIKTIGPVVVPTVSTNPATSVVADAATLNGTLDHDGNEACACGFEWGETVPYGNTTPTQSRRTGQNFAQAISGLGPGKTYHFRAFATNSVGISYGANRSFATAPVISRAFALAREEL